MPSPVLPIVLALIIALILIHTNRKSGLPKIVAYTQPWCPACQRLKPEWGRLKAMAGRELSVVEVEGAKCDHYPTILCNNVEYKGPRTAEDMKAWATRTAA